MTPLVLVHYNVNPSDSELLGDKSSENERSIRRRLIARGLSVSLARFVVQNAGSSLDSAIHFMDEMMDKLSLETSIHQREYLVKLLDIGDGDVAMAKQAWICRLRQVKTMINCDDSDARENLFASGFDAEGAVRQMKLKWTELLMMHASANGQDLTQGKAQALLQRNNWSLTLATRDFDAPHHIERLTQEIHRLHHRRVEEPRVLLESVDWDHDKALENWEGENTCRFCMSLYDDDEFHTKETGFCRPDCKGHMCYVCLCNFASNNTMECPFCNTRFDFYSYVESLP